MEVIDDPAAFVRPAGGTALTIGAYDGVHLGHQAVIGQVRDLARRRRLVSVVVTFDRHPAAIVRPGSAPRLLTDLDQKLEVLAATGVDRTVVVRFDHARSQEEPEDFVTGLLVGSLGAVAVVVGDDFHFGRARRGNVALLEEMGGRLGFEVVRVAPVAAGAGGGLEPVSSTAIRRLLAAGDVAGAAALLGRPHEVRGVVVAGDGRGRGLGFPTANVAVPPDVLLPEAGIYAGWYQRPGGDVSPAAVSLGRRPTFFSDGSPVVLEAFLIDFEGDLYGEAARVRFVSRLRGEERFGSVESLVEQMRRDVEATRRALAPGSV